MTKKAEWWANRISDVLNPFYFNVPVILFFALDFSSDVGKGLIFALIGILSASVLPMAEIYRRIRKGEASDPHLSRREERIKPLAIGLITTLAGLLLLFLLKAPPALLALLLAGFSSGTVLVAVTSFWKISLHAAGITGIATALSILYSWYSLPFWCLVLVVWWARLTLKQHDLAQLLTGSLVSAGITFATFYFFGLVK